MAKKMHLAEETAAAEETTATEETLAAEETTAIEETAAAEETTAAGGTECTLDAAIAAVCLNASEDYVVAEGRQIVAPSGDYLNAGAVVTEDTFGAEVFSDLIARGVLIGVAG